MDPLIFLIPSSDVCSSARVVLGPDEVGEKGKVRDEVQFQEGAEVGLSGRRLEKKVHSVLAELLKRSVSWREEGPAVERRAR